jgi:D-alanine-D-alanine ligase-like ATP-grasp enzyme
MTGSTKRPSMTLPDPARYAQAAANSLGADYDDLDNGAGYLFRLSKSGRHILCGAGAICSYPVNSATACAIARDKAHAKSALREARLPVIPGGLFFAQTHRRALRGPGREIEDARRFAATLGYPVFCKPNLGAKGNFAEVIPSPDDMEDYLSRVSQEYEAFLIEPVMRGMEHRIFLQDGEVVFHSTKSQPAVTGDAETTLEGLLEQLNSDLRRSGVSAYPLTVLSLAGRQPWETPARGERILLPGRRNLSAAGMIEKVSDAAPPELASIARRAAEAIGLRVAAIDLFDISPEGDLSNLVIIEVNGNPGLRTLELAGRMDLVLRIWIRMLSELLES